MQNVLPSGFFSTLWLNLSLWAYLLSAAPLPLSCVSHSTLIRVHWPLCWSGKQRIGRWQAKQTRRCKKTEEEEEVSSIFTVRRFRYPLLPERGIENDYLEEAEYVRALEWTVGWEILTSAESDQTSYPDERKIRWDDGLGGFNWLTLWLQTCTVVTFV